MINCFTTSPILAFASVINIPRVLILNNYICYNFTQIVACLAINDKSPLFVSSSRWIGFAHKISHTQSLQKQTISHPRIIWSINWRLILSFYSRINARTSQVDMLMYRICQHRIHSRQPTPKHKYENLEKAAADSYNMHIVLILCR